MEELFKWVITNDSITASGLILANLIALAVGLHRKLIVPGWIYIEAAKDRDEYRAAVSLRNAEDRETILTLQDRVSSLVHMLEDQGVVDTPPLKDPPRRARRDR